MVSLCEGLGCYLLPSERVDGNIVVTLVLVCLLLGKCAVEWTNRRAAARLFASRG